MVIIILLLLLITDRYDIVAALVTDIDPNPIVKAAMNDINGIIDVININ